VEIRVVAAQPEAPTPVLHPLTFSARERVIFFHRLCITHVLCQRKFTDFEEGCFAEDGVHEERKCLTERIQRPQMPPNWQI
jgi:hypothetical protein